MCWTITMLVTNLILAGLAWRTAIQFSMATSSFAGLNSTFSGINSTIVSSTYDSIVSFGNFLIYSVAAFFTLIVIFAIVSIVLSCFCGEELTTPELRGRYAVWIVMAVLESIVLLFVTTAFIVLIIFINYFIPTFSAYIPAANTAEIYAIVVVPLLISIGYCVATVVVTARYQPKAGLEMV